MNPEFLRDTAMGVWRQSLHGGTVIIRNQQQQHPTFNSTFLLFLSSSPPFSFKPETRCSVRWPVSCWLFGAARIRVFLQYAAYCWRGFHSQFSPFSFSFFLSSFFLYFPTAILNAPRPTRTTPATPSTALTTVLPCTAFGCLMLLE